jgi:hypothetical protein
MTPEPIPDSLEVQRRILGRCVRTARGCLEFTGGVDGSGYGQVSFSGRRMRAHRAVWINEHGPISLGLLVCHRCDNTKCVEPSHLFLGTMRDNMRDMVLKGRANKRRGANHHSARLTADQVRHIRRLYASGKRQKEMAAMFGVAAPTIDHIVHGRHWKEVL